jgi:hypothetical protein
MWYVALRCCGGVNIPLDSAEEPAQTPGRPTFGGTPDYRMPFIFCRFPGDVKQMLLSHQTRLVLYVRTGELQKEDVVRILYGASLPAIPRKRHGRVHLERGMHMFNA